MLFPVFVLVACGSDPGAKHGEVTAAHGIKDLTGICCPIPADLLQSSTIKATLHPPFKHAITSAPGLGAGRHGAPTLF